MRRSIRAELATSLRPFGYSTTPPAAADTDPEIPDED
jgi:hypothetical protein